MSVTNILEVEAPCCASIRECSVRYIAVIGIRDKNHPRILRTISSVRCHRGYEKKVKIYLSNDIIVVSHYVSNRGRLYINVIWKPSDVSDEEALVLAKKAFSYYSEEEIIL